MKRELGLLVLFAGVLGMGCDNQGMEECIPESRPAIVMEVYDGFSGQKPASDSVIVSVHDGDFIDLFRYTSFDLAVLEGPLRINLATDRAGTYEARVVANGYRMISVAGIVVPFDGCNVDTKFLDTPLEWIGP